MPEEQKSKMHELDVTAEHLSHMLAWFEKIAEMRKLVLNGHSQQMLHVLLYVSG